MAEHLPIDQQVIHNNKEIFAKLEFELGNAESEILVAVAWFTDPELFDILIAKLDRGVKVEIIIAENTENEKLNFDLLAAKGAIVIKIKNVGYGLMHQKFCVIDRKKALHGSYNWSVNAKNNNHESIIITDHGETVQSLIANFYDIKERATRLVAGELFADKQQITQEKIQVSIEDERVIKSEYERVLDSMIAAEVSSFNRESLRKQGFDRARANNGDHQVLNKALDTLYNGFLNDVDVIEDKKKRLLAKIDEQKAKTESVLKEKSTLQIGALVEEIEINQNNINNKIINLRSETLVNQSIISDYKDNKIPFLKEKIAKIEQTIKESMFEFVRPGIKWFEVITVSLIAFGLLLYLIMFYSSAAYILLYSEEDAAILLKTTSDPITPQIFNPDALSKAAEHGFMAVIFVSLFVLIPLTFSVLSRVLSNKVLANVLSYTLGVLVVDTFIAIKVAQSIDEIKSLTEVNPEKWSVGDVFYDINFYLVFIMGALGLILFKFCFEKIADFFDDRNPDVARQRNRLFVTHKNSEIKDIETEIMELNSALQQKENENILINSQIGDCENELEQLPLRKTNLIEAKKVDLNNKLQVIQTTTDIYKSHIENDNVPISIDALKDRINIFLEGWNDFLHEEYSVAKATQKSAEATETALVWESQKLARNTIDKRIRIQS